MLGPLNDHTGEIGTFAKYAKMMHKLLPKDIRKSENYKNIRSNTKRYFYDMTLARSMASGF